MLTKTISNMLMGLERDGIAVIRNFLTAKQLQGMQTALDARLEDRAPRDQQVSVQSPAG